MDRGETAKVRYPFKRLILGVMLAVMACQLWAGAGSEAAVKTAFLYNFFKFIEWPAPFANQAAFRLCTTEGEGLGENLSILANKKVSNKPIELYRHISLDELTNCHMIFIGDTADAAAIVERLKGLPIVTVSEDKTFIQHHGMIGLVTEGNRLAFEINLDAALDGGIHVSAQLVKLAKEVIKTRP
ncbi:MAG: YfiR family protein [Gammaproteobacteria bacterium]